MMFVTKRHAGYKAGLGLMLLGLLIFIIGFSSPYWLTTTLTANMTSPYFNLMLTHTVQSHSGLWVHCQVQGSHPIMIKKCVTAVETASAEWKKVVQALQVVCLGGVLIGAVLAFVVNFVRHSYQARRLLETILAASGVLGLVGAVLYVVKQGEARARVEDWMTQNNTPDVDTEIQHVAWATIVDVVGCVVILIAAVVIAVFNRPFSDSPAHVCFSGQQAGIVTGEAGNPGYLADTQPHAGGFTFHNGQAPTKTQVPAAAP